MTAPWARTITVSYEPEVFVGCTTCVAEGRTDRGVWVPADEADQVVTDQVHRGRIVTLHRGVDLHVDCLVVAEVRNIPAEVPMTPERAVKWGELYETVGVEQWPAFLAWVDAGIVVEDGDGLPSAGAFDERYAGCWESFEDFAAQVVEDTGLTSGWPETAVRYFDQARWARDLRRGFTVVDAPGGGVHVFRDL